MSWCCLSSVPHTQNTTMTPSRFLFYFLSFLFFDCSCSSYKPKQHKPRLGNMYKTKTDQNQPKPKPKSNPTNEKPINKKRNSERNRETKNWILNIVEFSLQLKNVENNLFVFVRERLSSPSLTHTPSLSHICSRHLNLWMQMEWEQREGESIPNFNEI